MNAENTRTDRSERRPFHCPVVVSWLDRSGQPNMVRAKCLELSPHGARILSEVPIDIRTQVHVQSPSHGLLGHATVRHCSRSGLRYTMGLMFSSASSQADEGRKRCVQAILADIERGGLDAV